MSVRANAIALVEHMGLLMIFEREVEKSVALHAEYSTRKKNPVI